MDDLTADMTPNTSRDFQRKAMKDPRYANTKPTEASTASKKIKDEAYAPWLISRLSEMHSQGLPVPEHWLDPEGELLKLIRVDVDPKSRFPGLYSPRPIGVTLKRELPEKLNLKPFSRGRILIHEMFHFVAGMEFAFLDNVSIVTRSSGFGGDISSPNAMGEDLLLEATTEALTRWAISELDADFSRMKAAEFFKGPSDVPPDSYINYQTLMARVFKDVPALAILKPYFSDSTSINGQKIIDSDRQRLDLIIDKAVRGGWDGLTQLQKVSDGFYPKQLPLESLITRPWLIAAKHARRIWSKSKAEEAFEHLVTNWEREQKLLAGEVEAEITPVQVDDGIHLNIDRSLIDKANGSGISRSKTPELETEGMQASDLTPEVIRESPFR